MKILIMSKYEETFKFAKALSSKTKEVQILRLDANLKDMECIVYDEIDINTRIVVVDSAETAFIANHCYINNALFFFLNLEKNKEESQFVGGQDFFTIGVKNAEEKTRNDWEQAADVFLREVSKGVTFSPNI